MAKVKIGVRVQARVTVRVRIRAKVKISLCIYRIPMFLPFSCLSIVIPPLP